MRKLTFSPNSFAVPSIQTTRLRPAPVEQPRRQGSPSKLNNTECQNLFRITNMQTLYFPLLVVDRRLINGWITIWKYGGSGWGRYDRCVLRRWGSRWGRHDRCIWKIVMERLSPRSRISARGIICDRLQGSQCKHVGQLMFNGLQRAIRAFYCSWPEACRRLNRPCWGGMPWGCEVNGSQICVWLAEIVINNQESASEYEILDLDMRNRTLHQLVLGMVMGRYQRVCKINKQRFLGDSLSLGPGPC